MCHCDESYAGSCVYNCATIALQHFDVKANSKGRLVRDSRPLTVKTIRWSVRQGTQQAVDLILGLINGVSLLSMSYNVNCSRVEATVCIGYQLMQVLPFPISS